MIGLGSVTDDVQAVVDHLRSLGQKVGVVSVKLLQPFPDAEVVAALAGKKAVTVLERSDVTALTSLVREALFKARENVDGERHPGVPALLVPPKLTTAIFGLGAHDLQPRHLVAAFKNMETKNAPFVYLGSQFFSKTPSPKLADLQAKLKAAYPDTELMALETEANPILLPKEAFRTRFHSVGGYGTIATGKLLTDILAGALDLHSKAAPKYGSEKSGAPTNYYITLSPDPVLITNAELEDVELVVSPDHKVFSHSNPLRGLGEGGTFILQSSRDPLAAWQELPEKARQTIREKKIKVFIIDAFEVAKKHAPTPELETRMMGIAFIGAVCGSFDRVTEGASEEAVLAKIRSQIAKKFGAKGGPVVEGNMAVIRDGLKATKAVDYTRPEFAEAEKAPRKTSDHTVGLSAAMCRAGRSPAPSGFLDAEYFDVTMAQAFRDGTIAEAPVMPGAGMFLPAGSAAFKDKGLFRRAAPEFVAELCTGCLECALVCPDAAIPNTVQDIREVLTTAIRQLDIAESQREALRREAFTIADAVRETYRTEKRPPPLDAIVTKAIAGLDVESPVTRGHLAVSQARSQPSRSPRRGPSSTRWRRTIPVPAAFSPPSSIRGNAPAVSNVSTSAGRTRSFRATRTTRSSIRCRRASTSSAACPIRRIASSTGRSAPEGDTKRLILDRENYYATTGGHGACRGCGEVTAIRLITATNHDIHDRRRKEHMREVEDLIGKLGRGSRRLRTASATRTGATASRTRSRRSKSASISSRAGREGRGRRAPSSPMRPAARASTPRPSRSTPTTTLG